MQRHAMNVRIHGRLAEELARLAEREHNSISSVARRLMTEGMAHMRATQRADRETDARA